MESSIIMQYGITLRNNLQPLYKIQNTKYKIYRLGLMNKRCNNSEDGPNLFKHNLEVYFVKCERLKSKCKLSLCKKGSLVQLVCVLLCMFAMGK